MRVRYYTDKKAAAVEFQALTMKNIACILSGPADYLALQTDEGTKFIEKEVYVLLSECEPAIANFTVVKNSTGNA